jgi:RES domain-containing protein
MGASLFGGRWNHKGTSVIYTAESRALCALEVLANSDELANDYVATPIEIFEQIAVTLISIPDLPTEWNVSPPIDTTRQIGTTWASGLRSAVLSVPSAVIPRERNYLINPAHPDFKRIRFHAPEPFYFDVRLGRAR